MIFYLSGTGNTRWAAQVLSATTGDRLMSIPEMIGSDCRFTLGENERIGFCFPVHGWRPPLIVRQFVAKLRVDGADGHYCYALCTAGDNIGETFDILAGDLANSGLGLDSRCSLIMPESYVGLPFMDVDTPTKEKAKKAAAAKHHVVRLLRIRATLYKRNRTTNRYIILARRSLQRENPLPPVHHGIALAEEPVPANIHAVAVIARRAGNSPYDIFCFEYDRLYACRT